MNPQNKLRAYLNNKVSPRERQQLEDLVDEGGVGIGNLRFGRDGQAVQDNAQRQLRNSKRDINNQKVERRDSRLGEGADALDKYLADRRLDAEQAAPYALAAGALAGGAALTGSALQAYNQQQTEYLPTGPLAVAGRMVSNIGGANAIGIDPLAEARNNVKTARDLVGSENVLAALTEDEIGQLRAEQEAALTPLELEELSTVQQMIDSRAEQLRGTPIQKSDGSVTPMAYDTAQRIATEQVAMELRAGNVY